MEPMVKVSILLVEDDEVARRLLAAILARRFPGALLYPAGCPSAALELFRKHGPDIVITDGDLPESSGLQLAWSIRAIRPGVKIIVLTAGGGNPDGQPAAGRDAGIDYRICKPVNSSALCRAVESCLAGGQGAAGDGGALSHLLDALEGDQQALVDLIGDFLVSYPAQLERISAAISSGSARHLEKSAHHFKGCLGIFCHSEPLALTDRLLEMGEQENLVQAPEILQLLQQQMEQLAAGLREFSGR